MCIGFKEDVAGHVLSLTRGVVSEQGEVKLVKILCQDHQEIEHRVKLEPHLARSNQSWRCCQQRAQGRWAFIGADSTLLWEGRWKAWLSSLFCGVLDCGSSENPTGWEAEAVRGSREPGRPQSYSVCLPGSAHWTAAKNENVGCGGRDSFHHPYLRGQVVSSTTYILQVGMCYTCSQITPFPVPLKTPLLSLTLAGATARNWKGEGEEEEWCWQALLYMRFLQSLGRFSPPSTTVVCLNCSRRSMEYRHSLL